MSRQVIYLSNVIAIARKDEDGRETYLIRPDKGLVSAIFWGDRPDLTACIELVSTVWGKRSMYVVRSKGS